MMNVAHDLRDALRGLRRHPLMAVLIAIELGIGLGASLAMFAVVDQVLLRKPAFAEPDRVVSAWEIDPREPEKRHLVATADFFDWQASGVFESSAVWMRWNANLTSGAMPQRVSVAMVSSDFFRTMGRAPLRGRALTATDALPDAADAVVISERLWRETFHGDETIVGKLAHFDRDTALVAGVMPADFAYPYPEVDVWTPIVFGKQFQRDDRVGRVFRFVGRLRSGVTIDQARLAVEQVTQRIAREAPKSHAGFGASLDLLHREETRELRPTILLLLAASAAMLIVAIANAFNLLLMRTVTRARETATRFALGANRISVLRRAAIDGALIGGASGCIAAALGAAAIRLLAAAKSDALWHAPIDMPASLLVRTIAIGIVIVAAGAMATSAFARQSRLFDAIRSSNRVAGGRRRLHGSLVIAQVALTTALVIPAALLVSSFRHLTAVDAGFDTHHLLTASIWLPRRYDTSERQTAFFAAAIDRLRATPGVADAASIQDLPLRRNAMTFDITIDDGRAQHAAKAAYRLVSDHYFSVMKIPILAGRALNAADDAHAPAVVVVNRALASRSFGSASALGRRIRIGGDGPWATVVGIAGDVKQMGLEGSEVPALYQPLAQKQFTFVRWSSFVVRTNEAVTPEFVGRIRHAIAAIDAEQPVYDIRTIDDIVKDDTERPRLAAAAVSYLALIALAVCLIGVAGVLSFTVTLRRREFGIRAALGARPLDVLALVLRNAASLAGLGIVAGGLAASAGTPLLQRILFEISPFDPRVILPVVVSIAASALAAGAIPAIRAARIDPARTLRSE